MGRQVVAGERPGELVGGEVLEEARAARWRTFLSRFASVL